MLRRVIECFYDQIYENKQLVIVYEDFDQPTVNFIKGYHFSPEVKLVEIASTSRKLSLGELRNISIQKADGEYVCQWDDDDWYDPERLSSQMQCIMDSGKAGCILSRWIVFDSRTKKAYLSNFRLWEGSILCKKEVILQKPYPDMAKGEDTSVIDYLYMINELYIANDMPYLYLYVYHGNNTWDEDHFKMMFEYGMEMPEEYLVRYITFLRRNMIDLKRRKYYCKDFYLFISHLSYVAPNPFLDAGSRYERCFFLISNDLSSLMPFFLIL